VAERRNRVRRGCACAVLSGAACLRTPHTSALLRNAVGPACPHGVEHTEAVDAAIPPHKKSSPKRALIVIGATVAGFLIGIFFALFQAGLQRIKNNPEARQKLHVFRSALSFRSSKSRLTAA
jgi:hypothetical protein